MWETNCSHCHIFVLIFHTVLKVCYFFVKDFLYNSNISDICKILHINAIHIVTECFILNDVISLRPSGYVWITLYFVYWSGNFQEFPDQ